MNDDQTLEGDVGETTEPTETEKTPEVTTDETPEVTPETPSNDPLDDIKDPEERAEAKRLRAIYQGSVKKTRTINPEKPDTPEPISDVASKRDIKVLVTKDAKKLVSPEVLEVWDKLLDIPLGGYDDMDADSIADNMQKRYLIFTSNNPAEGENPTADITKTPNINGRSGKGGTKPETKLPGYSEPTEPTNWYPEENKQK